jgi:phosphoribosyl 1,2-cyclic phosphodiesterase
MRAMITFALQSGSNGNSIYVEADGVRLLFDAGISGRQAHQRMAAHGADIRRVNALLVSHDHSDHIGCAGVYQRLFGFPVYMTPGTYATAGRRLGKVRDVRTFAAGATLEFGPVRVHTLRTPHDAVEGVAFIVECGRRRLGIFTDLGCSFAGLADALDSVDAAYLESNYDPEMLANGPYPRALQDRIRGDGGHLSNEEAARLLVGRRRRPDWIALAHLSEHNNAPDVALRTHRAALDPQYPLHVASRYGVSPALNW